METRYRPLGLQWLHHQDSLQDGDHPVGSSVSPSGQLDGLHRSEGGVFASPVQPESRKYLWFVAIGKPYQFRALCFGLSTALQVFTGVMAPISTILHSLGIRRYLDDWRIQANSRESVLQALRTVLSLCRELVIVVNPQKSNFVPAQRVQYLGTVIDAQTFKASPCQERINKLLSLGDEFLSSRLQPASTWQALLGTLSSLSHLVTWGLPPHASSSACSPSLVGSHRRFLRRPLVGRLSPGSSLVAGSRPYSLWGLSLSTLPRPRLLVRRGLGCSPQSRGRFGPLVFGRDVSFHQHQGVFGCGEGFSPFSLLRQPFHGRVVCRQLHGRGVSSQHGALALHPSIPLPSIWNSTMSVWLPSSSWWRHNVLANALSRWDQIQGLEWTLHMDVFLALRRQWPVMIDLFATSANHLFLTLPRSASDGDGRAPSILGLPPGLHVPSLGSDSSGPPQTPIVVQSCADSDRHVLASEALVPRSAGPSNHPADIVASSS